MECKPPEKQELSRKMTDRSSFDTYYVSGSLPFKALWHYREHACLGHLKNGDNVKVGGGPCKVSRAASKTRNIKETAKEKQREPGKTKGGGGGL